MPPKKNRVANSNSEEPIINLRRLTKARVDTEVEVTQDVRNNERLRVTRIDPLDEDIVRFEASYPSRFCSPLKHIVVGEKASTH